jgi:protease-4
MKQFFKFMFASMAGFILSIFVFFLIMTGIISGMLMTFKKDSTVAVNDKSILHVKFENRIRERTNNDPFENFDLSGIKTDKTPGLEDILKSIKKAENDLRIKGIFLDFSDVDAGIATVEEIRQALLDFKKGGKFIYAYGESFSQGAYYLASAADRIFLYPEGDINLRGLHADLMFFKGTLEKLEVKPEIIRHGKFKSAVEPFMYDKMSEENREQITSFLTSIWKNILNGISSSRNISEDELQKIADGIEGRKAEDAVNIHLVDQLAYYDEVLNELKKKTDTPSDDKLKFVTLKQYSRAFVKGQDFSAKKIAVIYANGEIGSGDGNDDIIGSDRIAGAIRKARTDSTVKAIVLRVNSPGGSALASDVIWRETVLAQKAKPFIVSMGDYAASGGYYIACAADTIVAQPNTITGSIGVFGLLFNAQEMFRNKFGITFDSVKTGKYADIGTLTRPMSDREREIIQEEVESIYGTFLQHVSDGRNMNVADIDSIGQGRVWSGIDAKRLGLVDVLGGLNDAVAIAAAKANVTNYRTISLPEQKEFFEKIIEDLNANAKSYFTKQQLGDALQYYEKINELINSRGILARMPFDLRIE